MQQSQNEHWRGRVKPGSSFSSRMLPYAAGAAIGATLTAALLWGTYNAGRTKGYSYAPDSQQQAAQQENYRLKKTADNPGKTAAKAPATIKTAAALHGEQRNNTAYRNPVCSSDYPQFKPRIDSEVPEKIKKGAKVLCAYVGDFLGIGQENLIGIAYSNKPETGHFGAKPYLFFYERTDDKPSEGVLSGLDSFEAFDDFKLEQFKITNLGLKQVPQLIVEYTVGGKKFLEIYGRGYERVPMTRIQGYNRVALAEGDQFHFADLNGDGAKELLVINGGQAKGIGAVKRPLAILSFVPAAFYQDGTVFDRYYLDKPVGPVAETQSKLAEAAISGNSSEILRIKDSTNPYVFVAASMGLFESSATSDQLIADLYGNPAAFLDRLFSSPQSAAAIVGAFAVQRFVYHVQARNDNKIDYNPAVGYTAMIDGQIHSGYRTKDDARRAIVEAEKRKHEEANRPSTYHTFKETTTDPRSGVTTEKRTTYVGGPPQTPAQWETNRAVNRDPVARGLNEAYHAAGAAKGEAEKKAGEIARGAGRALNEAAGNINRALEGLKRR